MGHQNEGSELIGLMALATGDTTGLIETQEARGQAAFVQQFDTLPKDGLHLYLPILNHLGFEIADPETDPFDDLFAKVTKVPEGWALKPTDHSMWSSIVDAQGVERGQVFYKAAFYDRSAHFYLNSRYAVKPWYEHDEVPTERRKVTIWLDDNRQEVSAPPNAPENAPNGFELLVEIENPPHVRKDQRLRFDTFDVNGARSIYFPARFKRYVARNVERDVPTRAKRPWPELKRGAKVIDRLTGAELFEGPVVLNGERSPENDPDAAARTWVAQHYPKYLEAWAYWPDLEGYVPPGPTGAA